MRDLRERITALMRRAQAELRARASQMSAEDFAQQRPAIARAQTALREQLLTLLLPTVPAPRAELFDTTPPQTPPADALLLEADRAMADALKQVAAGNQQAVAAQQREAEQTLSALTTIVDRWSVQLGVQTQGLSTLVAATSERLSLLEEFEARQIALLEKVDIAAADEKKVNTLSEDQLSLAEEVVAFAAELGKQNESSPDRDVPPLLSRLTRVRRAMQDATGALKRNDADRGIEHQERVADVLAEAYALVLAQNERLALLQDLLMFQRAVGFAHTYMGDIVAEQRDLLAATESVKPDDVAAMMPRFANLRRCLDEVAPLLDTVAARLDAGTPLVFAAADLDDAMASLEAGDKLDAIDVQDVAAESLEQVQKLVRAVQTETGYVAEIVNFLHGSVADAGMIAYQQDELRRELASGDPKNLQRFVEAQRSLLTQATPHDQKRVAATGSPRLIPPPDPLVESEEPGEPEPVFGSPAQPMQQAVAALESNDAAGAADAMELAVARYAENADGIVAVITMLHGLPSIEVTNQTEPAVVRLVDALALASAHKQVLRQTHVAEDAALPGLAKRQSVFAARCGEIAKAGESHPLLDSAQRHLAGAVSAFASSDRERIKRHQQAGDTALRHFIIEQALILETSVPPPSASEGNPQAEGPDSDAESAVTAGFISDFVSGEAPQDKQTEWEVLADRNRAALNQNFARELPLEYRGLLKNYYERVAE